MRGVEETAQAYRETRCRLNKPDMQPVHLNGHAVKWERGGWPEYSLYSASWEQASAALIKPGN